MPQHPECHCCRYNAQNYLLVCALHPSGPPSGPPLETCLDYDPDPNSENRQFRDFLELGEPVDFEAPITNPYHDDPEENWSPDGWHFVEGELRRVE